jgi:hypothetical protein
MDGYFSESTQAENEKSAILEESAENSEAAVLSESPEAESNPILEDMPPVNNNSNTENETMIIIEPLIIGNYKYFFKLQQVQSGECSDLEDIDKADQLSQLREAY